MRFFILILAFIYPCLSLAQLTSPGSNAIRYTSYPSNPAIKDPVFIKCNPEGTPAGSLSAARPRGTGLYDFSWKGWDVAARSFSQVIRSETAVASSTLSGLNEGGYRVDIYRGGAYDTSLTGWIVFDKPPVAIARLTNPLKHCRYVALDGEASATVPVFRYHDPGTGNQLNLANEVRSIWSSDPLSVIPYPELTDPVTYSPPLEDVTYTFRVNTAACSSQSSFFYESIHVKADFSADPLKGGAPLEVTFTDKSVRGTKKYSWDFGDRDRQGKKLPEWVVTKDSLWLFDNPFTHKYYFPGEYSVRLTIESEFGCVDSMRLGSKIEVEKSRLHIPNVFTPDGDGINDYFLVDAMSLRFIEISIFSRSGLKVYGFFGDGEKLRDWSGWDGTVINSPAKASPGIYFYIIRAAGWDDIEYDSEEYRGFVYLYR